jgi:hypothetical protein
MSEWESKWSHRLIVTLLLSVALSACGGGQTYRSETSEVPEAGSNTEKSIWVGVYTNGQAQRGRTAYLAKCASCHRDDLAGSSMAPALVGTGFLLMWDGKSVRDFYGRIRTTYWKPASVYIERLRTDRTCGRSVKVERPLMETLTGQRS